MSKRLADELHELEAMKRSYGPGCAEKCERLLAHMRRVRIDDVESLIRFHDALLFLRAFPHSEAVARLADDLLASLEPQVARLLNGLSAADAFDTEAVSGIVGTTVTNSWTLELARRLPSDIRRCRRRCQY